MNNIDILKNIKLRINNEFPVLNVYAYYDEVFDELYISIYNSNIYYSKLYQELITDINIDFLWENDIYNVLFILGVDDDNNTKRI